LDLIVRTYPKQVTRLDPILGRQVWTSGAVDRWTWRLWSGSRIVSTSGSQLYSRRIDCARGAEVGAGLFDLVNSGLTFAWRPYYTEAGDPVDVAVRIVDQRERGAK
jgi:hypothetical protein